jgi:hypothetical protein
VPRPALTGRCSVRRKESGHQQERPGRVVIQCLGLRETPSAFHAHAAAYLPSCASEASKTVCPPEPGAAGPLGFPLLANDEERPSLTGTWPPSGVGTQAWAGTVDSSMPSAASITCAPGTTERVARRVRGLTTGERSRGVTHLVERRGNLGRRHEAGEDRLCRDGRAVEGLVGILALDQDGALERESGVKAL